MYYITIKTLFLKWIIKAIDLLSCLFKIDWFIIFIYYLVWKIFRLNFI